ncbi:GNAT family N-acetyltransferase [Bifidobacterium crudilactis]|jgi:ribosomal protein S18 acetylase RimI-like enzyme|uniref:GNAT family N-acetyltransferase n=1 Tax=Bifidobacterium crudilactis TaxID=327277 RepID=A0A971CYK6_9BIFI|nr:GNAT family N-acetyltransferase [Bifidobacterium crudilactis]MCI1664625.1 GNAT family N-acetyltransferase [Bifidobacterium crudilactis]MCI1869285.1 GNAT family N-acetyltransferase [Bifidobacterium crudilactis]MCI2148102.1 GNAT family N-acetyltransferase [Bifidobacterium crudilactis]MCI2157216.1 GNAT family N-acetyltransferase [Bifidobacterium crudilactis]MDN5972496.1 GNAT family N-acetyltransferase [Bifidobacterium crudilactis]
MDITYTTERNFTKDDVRELFSSVGWVSANYPKRLLAALMGSSMVFTAWKGVHLAGLVRVLDDGSMTAYVHYVLVDPEYQGHGIAGHLMSMVKDHYKDYLYVEVMPEESRNASFYQQHGFSIMQDGIAMQTVNDNFAD